MSRKLIVINLGGREYMGEEPQKWPPNKGEEFLFKDVMLLDHQVVGSPKGPARVIFVHPMSDYRVKSYVGWRPAMRKEVDIYNSEKLASSMVQRVALPPELEKLLTEDMPPEKKQALIEEFMRSQGAGPPQREGGIVTP